jgi:hypothetical protein
LRRSLTPVRQKVNRVSGTCVPLGRVRVAVVELVNCIETAPCDVLALGARKVASSELPPAYSCRVPENSVDYTM